MDLESLGVFISIILVVFDQKCRSVDSYTNGQNRLFVVLYLLSIQRITSECKNSNGTHKKHTHSTKILKGEYRNNENGTKCTIRQP